jgi:cobalt transporter subunit CbtB
MLAAPHSVPSARPTAIAAPGTRVQALFAMLLGLAVVGFVGFSHLEVVHNAAHDTRHANAFPCH